jgi:hypothetical protein
MNARPASWLVVRIGGCSLGLLAILLTLRLWQSLDPVRSPSIESPPAGPLALSEDSTPLAAPPPPPAVPALVGQAAVDALQTSPQYASLRDALQAARYSAEKIDPTGPHSRGADYFVANPAQQLRAWFSQDGIELASGRRTAEGAEPWSIALRLRGVGRLNAVEGFTPGGIVATGSRVEMRSASGTLTQWFENRAEGIEQGFTLEERPPGAAAEVAVLLDVRGSLAARAEGEVTALHFIEGRETVLEYKGLKAWDATGRELLARMEVRGSSVALCVADAGATYPVSIDPLFVNVEARLAENSVAGDHFGTAVAISGDTALVGADEADTPDGSEAGAAYVFVRSGAGSTAKWYPQTRLVPNNPSAFARFGTSVALDGDTALIGAPAGQGVPGVQTGAAYFFVRSSGVWSQQGDPLAAPNAAAEDLFGAVALRGDRAIVGASLDDTTAGGANAGSACIYGRSGTGAWTFLQQIFAPSAAAGDKFGAAVAIAGDLALIGAPERQTAAGSKAGIAYIFAGGSGTWSSEASLQPETPRAGAQFGTSVDLDGGTAIVGAQLDDPNGQTDAGSATVFVRGSSNAWPREQTLFAATPTAKASFGYAVTLRGDVAVVGALEQAIISGEAEAISASAHVFFRTGTQWSPASLLAPVDTVPTVRTIPTTSFGAALDFDGTSLIVGAYFDRTLVGPQSGTAEIFLRNGNGWTPQATLVASDSPNFDRFGYSVAGEGTLIAIGSEFDDTIKDNNTGTAYVFAERNSGWVQVARLSARDGTNNSGFGRSIAVHDDQVYVGAPGTATSAGSNVGAVYVFSRSGPVWNQRQRIDFNGAQAFSDFGSAVAAHGQTLLIGVAQRQRVQVFGLSGSTWQLTGTLSSGGLPEAGFGSALAYDGATAIVGAPLADNGAGRAYVFARNATAFDAAVPIVVDLRQQDAGSGSNMNLGDRAGTSVAISGTTALVASPYHDAGVLRNRGRVTVYVRTARGWESQATLTSAPLGFSEAFGFSAALAGDRALVGAPLENTTSGNDAGAAYLFTRKEGVWSPQARLTAGVDASTDDQFGNAATLLGDFAVVTAFVDGAAGEDSGSAFLFRIGDLPEITRQPLSASLLPNRTVIFDIAATGSGQLAYRWRKNGVEIAGATGSTLTVGPVVPDDAGSYDVIVSNLGGAVTSAPAVLVVNEISETANRATPGAPDQAQGFLLVNLEPIALSTAAAGLKPAWRFVGEQEWRAPGVPVGGLTTGDRRIEFRPVPGQHQPLAEAVAVFSGQPATVITRTYYESDVGTDTGELRVFLQPADIADPTQHPQPTRAQWRLLGQGAPGTPADPASATWIDSGGTSGRIVPGSYLIECKEIPGRATPPPQAVQVPASAVGATPTQVTIVYFLPDAPAGPGVKVPEVLSFDTVTRDGPLPYAFVGQVRSELGAGSGFLVRPRVVITTAHVVFDDARLTAAPTGTPLDTAAQLGSFAARELQWLLQRDRASYEPGRFEPGERTAPKAQTPRGFYVLTSYAARRIGAAPGQSTPLSQNRDVAALYFLKEDRRRTDGRAVASGFLASDADENEFLSSSALKTLVGYPAAAPIPVADRGRMHASAPAPIRFERIVDVDPDFTPPLPLRLYRTTELTSYSGSSGGPLCVQWDDGIYYPAAIYLGGTQQTIVRTFDTQFANLVKNADTSANGGDDNVNDSSKVADPPDPNPGLRVADLVVKIEPPLARSLGGSWRLKGGSTYFQHNDRATNQPAGRYILEYFGNVPGFDPPVAAETRVTLIGDQVTTHTARYLPRDVAPTILNDPKFILRGRRGQAITPYSILAAPSAESFEAPGLEVTGLTLNAQTGVISGTPTRDGAFTVLVRARNTRGADEISLQIVIAVPGELLLEGVGLRGSVGVSPARRNNQYDVDTLLKLVAKPNKPAYLFDEWEFVGGSDIGDRTKPVIQFKMTPTVSVAARFVENPYLTRSGSYAGLIATSTGTPRALLTVTVTSVGKFTAKVVLDGVAYSGTGELNARGQLPGTLKLAGKPSRRIDATLALDLSAANPRLSGQLVAGDQTLALEAVRSAFTAKDPTRLAGVHTLALRRPASFADPRAQPFGHGYVLLRVSPTGAVTAAGQMGDGVPLSAGGLLRADERWVLFARPYKTAGPVVGTIVFTAHPIPGFDELAGTLRWERLAADISAIGSRWIPPGPTAGSLTFDHGGLLAEIEKTVTVDAAQRYLLTPADGNRVTLVIKSANGFFAGTVKQGAKNALTYKGAFLRLQKQGRGVFVAPIRADGTGEVNLEAP